VDGQGVEGPRLGEEAVDASSPAPFKVVSTLGCVFQDGVERASNPAHLGAVDGLGDRGVTVGVQCGQNLIHRVPSLRDYPGSASTLQKGMSRCRTG
jgi:hypothetical protein